MANKEFEKKKTEEQINKENSELIDEIIYEVALRMSGRL